MLRRRYINANPRGRGARFLSGVADIARWPFERAAWSIERHLLWPLRERLVGWSPPGHRAGVGALAAIAVAAALVGVFLLRGDDASRERVAAETRVAVATPEPQPKAEEPPGPVLHGASPNFGIGKGIGVAQASGGAGDELNAGSPDGTPAASDEAAPSEESAATTSSKEPVPAGPVAMKVARRFSEAFVFYEIGERRVRAKTVFGETATPRLATALAERPPRLPEDAKVPKAQVVNLVPGPRVGKAYTVSVSLLRVGLTSELRLELNKKSGSWVVTDVRG
jgi:hypothetical protein